uniref:Uncharacterized protein n=1 Tax=Romanomermis culicivorax TaxID=13658 RepID=A0A915INF5_ROMCU
MIIGAYRQEKHDGTWNAVYPCENGHGAAPLEYGIMWRRWLLNDMPQAGNWIMIIFINLWYMLTLKKRKNIGIKPEEKKKATHWHIKRINECQLKDKRMSIESYTT